ncbi:allantoate amidohydrolase [Cutibacterium sp.]|uniref:allantoate amidohydrolase n=1 Tax=Cutibacterium sp. TaxID=1912221 RepID=UPI0026DB76D3|nr:allantoate amidohydrolase [Cutibacterium sp.]MDO4412387.1 allantoate amidohydrolase [Cutibacterium sp.]
MTTWTAATLLNDISEIGRNPDGSYSRFCLLPDEVALREWFVAKATELGLTIVTDMNANIWAWWGIPGPMAVLTGSHLDSVPGGGAYDGPLGVVSSLVAVAKMKQAGVTPSKPFAVVAMADEEGARFAMPCLGSRLASGKLTKADAHKLIARDGQPLPDAWREAGLDPDLIAPDDVLLHAFCFVELHVEQGRGLADLGYPVAIATAVRPHGRWRAEFTGQGNHAGTTLIPDRHDPVVPVAETILAARGAAEREGCVTTVGRISVEPGGTNVIASAATMWLDCRAEDPETVTRVVEDIQKTSQEAADKQGCRVVWTRESWTNRTVFDDGLRNRILQVLGEDTPQLSTGAGHDAATLATAIPTAMLFVRNPTGASHCRDESASDEDCEAGAEALRAVLEELVR